MHSVNRVFKIARRAGTEGVAGALSSGALQSARKLALEAGALDLDVDDATIAGLEAGRSGWDCNLLDVTVPEVGAVKQEEKDR
jgi:hypothetical protein